MLWRSGSLATGFMTQPPHIGSRPFSVGDFGSQPHGWLFDRPVHGYFQNLPQIDPEWRLLCITGFLGALTTFSTFSAEVVGMLQQGRLLLALGTASMHLIGSLVLTYFGLYTVKMISVSPIS